jgi:hypothetical protein
MPQSVCFGYMEGVQLICIDCHVIFAKEFVSTKKHLNFHDDGVKPLAKELVKKILSRISQVDFKKNE